MDDVAEFEYWEQRSSAMGNDTRESLSGACTETYLLD